jgi:CRP-like cAMP-binding protein
MESTEAMKKSFVFSSLENEELAQVLNITIERRFREGDPIMQEGEEGDTMYMIVEGEVEVSKSLTMKFGDDDFRKTDKVLTRFRPQDHVIFGEMGLIAQDRRSASIVAKTECTLLEIKRDDFLRLVENSPQLGAKILLKLSELLSNRLRQTNKDIVRLTTALSIALSK